MLDFGEKNGFPGLREKTNEIVREEQKLLSGVNTSELLIETKNEGDNLTATNGMAKKKIKHLREDNLKEARCLKYCDVCSQPFRHVSSLLDHKKSMHPDRPKFECSDCKEKLTSWAAYEKHLKKHHEPETEMKTVKCDVCSKDFEYINSLVQHRRVTHPTNKVYTCTLCGLTTTLYKDYKLHLRLSHKDSGVKLSLSCLICDICGKEFLCHYNLSNHRKYHGSPQFKCNVCNKLFKAKKSLQGHQRIHTGEKPYTCETCGKSFPGKSYLINHGVTHSGQKPFVCEVCGKAFSKKWNMIQHERIHTGERPYKCPVCSQGFIQNFILKDHMKKVHNRDLKEFAKSALESS